MERIFEAIVVSHKEVAENTHEVAFEIKSDAFSFLPGQYVWVVIDELKYPDERGNRRCLSIVSDFKENNGQIRCVFRNSESGFKKSLIEMPIGSKVRVDGPFGYCTLPPDESAPIVFIAGGVGIASIFTMINYLALNKSPRRMVLVYANNNPKQVVYVEELENLQRENKNFSLISCFGNLNEEIIIDSAKDLDSPLWYVLGPEEMVFEIGEIFRKNNIRSDRVETEEFALPNSEFYKENREIIKSDYGLKLALDNAFNHIIITDSNGMIMYANHGAELITGYKFKEMIGQTPRLWGSLGTKEFYELFWKTIKEEKKVFDGEVRNRKKSGEIYTARIKVSPFLNNQNGNLIGFVGVEEDISKEKEIEKIRTDFLSLASHQLRTPLSGTKWLIETLNRKILGPINEKQGKYIDQIYQANERMIKLVYDMLSVLRLESGTFPVKIEIIPISDIYKQLIINLDAAAKNKEISLKNVSETQGTIETDVMMLSNVIDCVISNAINYSKPGTSVILDLKREKTDFIFSVKDTGIGIPEDEKKRIFQRFYRSSNAKEFKPDGTGLGLHIASMLAEKIGAQISFDSEENKGSIFYVRVPEKVEKKV